MENVLEFNGEKYYGVGCLNFYRTEDGKKMFFILANQPVWLSSDSPIHIELREHVMMDKSYPYGDVEKFDKGVVCDLSSNYKGE